MQNLENFVSLLMDVKNPERQLDIIDEQIRILKEMREDIVTDMLIKEQKWDLIPDVDFLNDCWSIKR